MELIPPVTFGFFPRSPGSSVLRFAAILSAAILAIVPVSRSIAGDPVVLEAATCGVRAGDGSDSTPGVRAALEKCQREKIHKLVFAPGRYDFWPDRAADRYLFISNNDQGLKRILFPLVGFDGIEIDGRGASFVLHGFLVPFLVEKSRAVTVENLSIDYARTFHSEAKVLGGDETGLEVEIPEAFPFDVRNGVLVFTDGRKDHGPQTTVKSGEILYPYGSLLEFDAKRRETAFMAKDYWAHGGVSVQRTGPRKVRILMPKLTATPGNILVFGASHRDVPGFTISDSANVSLRGISIYHCGGMGVIAQRSRDLELERVRVTPAPDSGRIVSVTADATHFVNCTGHIEMRDCLFENQKDDATNIHGIYARVARKIGPSEMEVQLVHSQQFGFDFIEPDIKLELVHGASLVTFGEVAIKSVERINAEYTHVVTQVPLPDELQPGDAVARTDANTAEVVIRGCTIRNNRARGILLGSRGKILVENNLFHTPGAAILMEGDARFWFEQAGVRELTIRKNRFENCNFGVWGHACIEVGAGITKDFRAASRYNRKVTVEDNDFLSFKQGGIVLAYSVDGLTFRRNHLEQTTAYPAPKIAPELFDITCCDNVVIAPGQTLSGQKTAGAK